jgi:hypothetical protein
MGRLLRLVNDRSTFWDWMVLRARHRPSRAVVSPRRPQFLASFARDFELFPYVRQSSHINTTPTEVCFYISSALQIAMGCNRLAPLSERDTAPLFDKS